MPAHHRVMNMIYDHPFVLIFITGLPIVGTILSSQMKHTHLTLSQKIMHSRVYAQGGILAVAVTTMAFRDYMDKNGRFPEPND